MSGRAHRDNASMTTKGLFNYKPVDACGEGPLNSDPTAFSMSLALLLEEPHQHLRRTSCARVQESSQLPQRVTRPSPGRPVSKTEKTANAPKKGLIKL